MFAMCQTLYMPYLLKNLQSNPCRKYIYLHFIDKETDSERFRSHY